MEIDTKMIIALDIDDTVTAHPAFFLKLFDAWLNHTGNVPLFITARDEKQREATVVMLNKLGFPAGVQSLKMFPHAYPWPYANKDDEMFWRQTHSNWKANVCLANKVDVLIDDCHHNVSACRAAGIFVLQVMAPTDAHAIAEAVRIRDGQ